MSDQQAENFIAILRTACKNGQRELHNPDWEELAKMARSQMLTALFYTGATQYKEFQEAPAQQRIKLQQETIVSVAQQARRTQIFLQLYQELLNAGLRPLVLKGIICRNLYGDLADYRPSSDEDLYLPPGDVEKCRQVLAENGWYLISHEASMEVKEELQEIAFNNPNYSLPLELHPSLFGTENPSYSVYNQYFRDVERRAVSVVVQGSPLYTMGFTDHYLYLFLHLAKHFSGSGVGIRQIIDMMQFARSYGDQIDWQEIKKGVQALTSPGLYADVVAIGQKLGFEAEQLFVPVQPDLLLKDSIEGGIYGYHREGGGSGSVLTLAALYPTWWGRFRRLIFPSPRQLLTGRPWLEKRPWLLPIVWGQRATRLFMSDGQWKKVTGKSLQVAYRRIHLLGNYGLLPGRKPTNWSK